MIVLGYSIDLCLEIGTGYHIMKILLEAGSSICALKSPGTDFGANMIGCCDFRYAMQLRSHVELGGTVAGSAERSEMQSNRSPPLNGDCAAGESEQNKSRTKISSAFDFLHLMYSRR